MSIIKVLLPVFMLTSVFSASGSTLYNQKCKSCHGAHAEKKAMGKSKVIAGMSVSDIEKAMHDYSSGKRRSMSFVMKVKQDFVKHHSKKELHDLAVYIHSL
jgi:cytochrome c553